MVFLKLYTCCLLGTSVETRFPALDQPSRSGLEFLPDFGSECMIKTKRKVLGPFQALLWLVVPQSGCGTEHPMARGTKRRCS